MITPPPPSRPLDLVIWGATGFAGRLAVAYLSNDPSKFFSFHLHKKQKQEQKKRIKWAIAGRNESKLKQILHSCHAPPTTPIFIIPDASSSSISEIDDMVRSTRVICSFAGPFVHYTDAIVSSCVRFGTHHVDICGETAWVRSCVDRFDHVARGSGACVVNFCGFDSIPSDMGCYFAVDRLRMMGGVDVKSVKCYQVMFTGGKLGMSGGTLQSSIIDPGSEPKLRLSHGVDVDSPFLLGGYPSCGTIRDIDQFRTEAVYIEELECWAGPFVMEKVNAVATRRSSSHLKYGSDFNYQEWMLVPTEEEAKKLSDRAKYPVPKEKVKKMIELGRLPKPGEGPTPQNRANMAFLALLVAEDEAGRKVCVAVRGGEPAYEETCKMAIESSLALILQPDECPGYKKGGFQSTAMCFGNTLIGRLNDAGICFYQVDDPKEELHIFMAQCYQRMSDNKKSLEPENNRSKL